MGNENMTASPSGTFRTGDGLLNIAANKQQQFETLCRLIGREALIADPRFAGREDRKRRRFELNAEIEQALAARSAREWSAHLNAHGVPAGEVLDVPSVLEHPQIVERGLLKTFESRAGGRPSRAGGAIGLSARERRSGAGVAAAGARRRH